MTLSFQIYDSPDRGIQLADYTHLLRPPIGGGLQFGSNHHGFAGLSAPFIPLLLGESFRVLNWPKTAFGVVTKQGGGVAWEGRIEPKLVDGGIALTGLGQWQAFRDVLYSAMWSYTQYNDWRPLTQAEIASTKQEKYHSDKTGRLYATLRKNEAYGNTVDTFRWILFVPDASERDLIHVAFDYDITLPNNWDFRTSVILDDLTGAVVDDTITSAGSNLTGSKSITVTTGKQAVVFNIRNNTGSTYTNTGETDDWRVIITNIRVKTTSSAAVYADEIAEALVTYVNGINSSQITTGTDLIESPAEDLHDEIYEDERPSDILDYLARVSNYEVGVWENRLLHFRPVGDVGRTFYVDVVRITNLETTAETLYNSVYAVYRDENGRALRTATSTDTDSVTKYGLTRMSKVNANTTDSTQATAYRDAFLTDFSDYALRADIVFDRLYTASGAEVPLYELRASDELVMRNLPPTLSQDIDNLRRFRLRGVTFDAATVSVAIEPEVPTPTLVTLIARREAGL